MSTLLGRALALLAVLAVAAAVGAILRRRQGRARAVRAGAPSLAAADLGTPLGARATLLQISAPVCGPCRAAHRVLAAVAAAVPGVRHLDLDAEQHLDLVRRLDVLRTPTLLVLDAAGQVVRRASGVPTPAQVHAALAAAGVDPRLDVA